jgi:rRNA maturation endonuclease Nob1
MEEDIKARQDWTKVDTDREKRRADIEVLNEMMEGREAGRKAYVTICTTEFNIQNSAFCPQIISVCGISFLE